MLHFVFFFFLFFYCLTLMFVLDVMNEKKTEQKGKLQTPECMSPESTICCDAMVEEVLASLTRNTVPRVTLESKYK